MMILLSLFFRVWSACYGAYILCAPAIYTPENVAQCIHVRGDRIRAIGTLDDIQQRLWWSPPVYYTKPGSVIVPGLADAHAHVIENGLKTHLPLDKARSPSHIVDILRDYILSHPEIESNHSRWIMGWGWNQENWPDKNFPTAQDLDNDPLLKGRPIALHRIDGHALWVSSKVLELTGPLPTDVEGGLIVRDSEGKPTGVLLDNAIQLIQLPELTEEQVLEFAKATFDEALSRGLTSIHDAATEPYMISFFQKQAKQGNLPLRMYLMGFSFATDYWGALIPKLTNYGKHQRLNVRSIKLFADGALGSWGAALIEPYTDKPETNGLLLSDPDKLKDLVRQFRDDGFQVNIHCIGDKANNVVLDIFESLLEDNGTQSWRPRIEHAQIMTPGDLERIGRLGVIPSVQPTHATSDMWYAEKRLGPERIRTSYAYKTLRESAGRLPLGSDFPVEGVNPLLGFYAAITRISPDGDSSHGENGWYSSERLSRSDALKGMTIDAAYASFAEHELGSLAPGKKADFVVLDRDIMSIPASEILATNVLATVIDGRVAYGQL